MFNQQGIRFEHLVVFEDNQIFASARVPDTRRIRLFLINETTGDVYSRNGKAESWEEIYGDARSYVVNNIYNARQNRSIPVYNLKTAFSAFSA